MDAGRKIEMPRAVVLRLIFLGAEPTRVVDRRLCTADHRGFATRAVAHPTNQEAADRTRDEADPERRKRGQQAGRRRARREKGFADVHGEEGVGKEIVELERVARNDCGNMTRWNRSSAWRVVFIRKTSGPWRRVLLLHRRAGRRRAVRFRRLPRATRPLLWRLWCATRCNTGIGW